VLDALDEVDRAREAGVTRALVRVTAGIEADTHEAIRTGQRGSKFGLPPDHALVAIERARPLGLHVHIGSQLTDAGAARHDDRLARRVRGRLPERLGVDADYRRPRRRARRAHVARRRVAAGDPRVRRCARSQVEHAWALHDLAAPRLILEPGRSVVGPAGVTLYTVGVVKQASESVRYVAIDGGMSDNPRPQLYGARYTALLANRADEPTARTYRVAGKHCESGDVLIDASTFPIPARRRARRARYRRVHARHGVELQRRAAPGGGARRGRQGTRRPPRETIDDLLALES
jgi:diaminopimelate decarboxylase